MNAVTGGSYCWVPPPCFAGAGRRKRNVLSFNRFGTANQVDVGLERQLVFLLGPPGLMVSKNSVILPSKSRTAIISVLPMPLIGTAVAE